jgi:hypothetical protein
MTNEREKTFSSENLRRRHELGDLDTDTWIISKWTSYKQGVEMGAGLRGSGLAFNGELL